MEDVVGIKARDRAGRVVAFMTWGRLFDSVDAQDLLKSVEARSATFDGGPMTDLTLCNSLSEVSGFEYFYEALLQFAREPIPSGKDYETWRREKRANLTELGKELFFLGRVAR